MMNWFQTIFILIEFCLHFEHELLHILRAECTVCCVCVRRICYVYIYNEYVKLTDLSDDIIM